jgi:hypothetical protein
MSEEYYKVKIGDKLIANDAFNSFGYVEGVVTKVTPYKTDIHLVNVPSHVTYGITICATFKRHNDITGKEYTHQRNIETCNFKVNPTNPDVNIDWSNYGLYCKAIFFTSEDEKKKFHEMKRKYKMNYHLNRAKLYGYTEK